MLVGQSRFQQKSTCNLAANKMHSLFKCLQTSQGVTQLQRNYLNFCRINSLLFVLLRAKKTIFSWSVTKNIHCLPASNEAVKFLSQLDGSQIKEVILRIISNFVEEFKKQAKLLKQSISDQFNLLSMPKQFNGQEIGKLTNLYLSQLLENMKNSLKTQYKSKMIYAQMNFKWSNEFVRTFILAFNQPHPNLAQLQRSVEHLDFEVRNLVKHNSSLIDYERLTTEQLLNNIQNKKIASLVRKKINMLSYQLTSKANYCETLEAQIGQCNQMIRAQMAMLNKQEQQKSNLKQKIMLSKSELQNLNKKCSLIERELQKMNVQIKNLKQKPSAQPSGYYINPFWQKQQFQQKYFMEIIQLQSDLLMEKEQSKTLVNIVLQEIKLSHEFFSDLRASKYTIYRFDGQIFKLLKTTSAFDKINLEEHLSLREESHRSQTSPQMYKSTISTFTTFSDADIDGKMRSQKQIMQFEINQPECKQQ